MKKIDDFEKNTFIVFFMSIVAGIVNYIYQIIIGKMLGISDYGIANVILAFVSYLGVFLGPISVMACQYSAMYSREDKQNKLKSFVRWIIKYTLAIEIAIFLIGIAIVCVLKFVLREISFSNMIFVIILLPSNSFYTIMLSIIQGMQKFTVHGIIGIIFNLVKLLGSVFLVYIGWNIIGIVFAMLCSQLICVGLCLKEIKKSVKLETGERQEWKGRDLLRYYGDVFVSQIFYFFYVTGGDIIILRLFFDNQIVGLYSAVATLGKLVFFVVTPITTVLFPVVAEKKGQGEETKTYLVKALIYSGIVSLGFLVFLNLLGDYIISLLYGIEFISATNYLLCGSVYIMAVIIFTVLYQYQVAVGEVKIVTRTLIVANVIICSAVVRYHTTPQNVIYIVGIFILMASLYILWQNFKKKISR